MLNCKTRYFLRYLPKDFNYYEYINNYVDICFLNYKQAKQHYLYHGIYEKRVYNTKKLTDFSYEIYKNLYDDVKKLSNVNLLLHYIRYGKFEKRICRESELNLPKNFDVKLYRYANLGLFDLSDIQVKVHCHKRSKDKSYMDNIIRIMTFDYNFYINFYDDISKYTREEAFIHFIRFGLKEGRKCMIDELNIPAYFNVYPYKILHPELEHLTPLQIKIHFYKNVLGTQNVANNNNTIIKLKDEIILINNLIYEFNKRISKLLINNINTLHVDNFDDFLKKLCSVIDKKQDTLTQNQNTIINEYKYKNLIRDVITNYTFELQTLDDDNNDKIINDINIFINKTNDMIGELKKKLNDDIINNIHTIFQDNLPSTNIC